LAALELTGHHLTSNSSCSELAISRAKQTGPFLFAATVLILLNLFCYARSLKGYFLADDYVHVAYLSDVLNSQPLRLLENFTGNWMHAWGTQFYRPFITLTLAFDYLVGAGSALSFHLSNLVYHFLGSLLLFLVSGRILHEFSGRQQYLSALAAAALFAVCPLHTEVVSWIIGRVDGVCLTFFLAAFYFHLRSRRQDSRLDRAAAILCFAISLLSKEMALTLPLLVVLTEFCLAETGTPRQKAVRALKASLSFWVLLFIYAGVRFLALGTLAGGYGGSIGEGLSGSALARFSSLAKILLPFNLEVISPFDRLHGYLLTLYRLAAVFMAARIAAGGISLRDLKTSALCLGWFILSLAPAYPVFNITDSLMCSRFAYFATAPFCLALALLLSPVPSQCLSPWRQKLSFWLQRISPVLIVAFVLVLTGITTKNNSAWIHAGDQVRAFRDAVAAACSKLPADGKLVLLNTPQRLEGAHMIYNGAMLQVLLSEPLSSPPLANRVLSFEPPTYGDPELINTARLRRLVRSCPHYRYCYWDMGGRRLINLDLIEGPSKSYRDLSELNESPDAESTDAGQSIISPEMNWNAFGSDFVIFSIKLPERSSPKTTGAAIQAPPRLTLYFQSANFPSFSPARSLSLPALCDGVQHDYYFPVSEHKSWLAAGNIKRLRLALPARPGGQRQEQATVLFLNTQAVSGHELMPVLTPASLAEGADGIDRLATDNFELRCDCSKIPGCVRIALELSNPNSWFEHYAGTFREREFSTRSLKRFYKDGNTASFQFTRRQFPQAAYYEIRAFALDSSNKVIGYCSDPINLQIN
jgi:hypothetical protein